MHRPGNVQSPGPEPRGVWLRSLRRAAKPATLAAALSFALLLIPAYQIAATLLQAHHGASEITEAIVDGVATWPVRAALAQFAAALVLLHGMFAVALLVLAVLAERLHPRLHGQTAGLVVLWWSLATTTALGLNALWFPQSESGGYYHQLATHSVIGVPAAEVLAWLTSGLACLVLAMGTWRNARRLPPRHAVLAALVLGSAILLARHAPAAFETNASVEGPSQAGRPNIVVLGIDSLRLDQLGRNGGRGNTPNLDQLLTNADVFADVTTPVARTFPAWVAILSGRSPRETGAVSNLLPRRSLNVSPTFVEILRESGYRTVLATDEVRFSNIDESYGFDQLITPPMGAADFLVSRLTDLPLANVIANTGIGNVLFPYTHANRAAAKIFQPRSFIQRLEAELSFKQPTLLVAHLCAAHWPYVVAGVPASAGDRLHDDHRPLYDIGLQTADDMLGRVMAILQGKGALQDAVVIVLSDHGEGLGLSGDSLLGDDQLDSIAGLQAPITVVDAGHGQSVLSPVQYQVLLGFRSFGQARGYRSSGRELDIPATLLDVAPTVLDLAGIPEAPRYSYAESLRPLLVGADHDHAAKLLSRPRFTETDLRALTTATGDIDEDASARTHSALFEVNEQSGRLELRASALPGILSSRERAVLLGPFVLAALPAGIEHHQFVLVDRTSGSGRVLEREPLPDDPALPLWRALLAEFGAELRPPRVARTPVDSALPVNVPQVSPVARDIKQNPPQT